MRIEQFIARSEGEWQSMRTGHSLAFKQFEEVLSRIRIKALELDNPKVIALLDSSSKQNAKHIAPFQMEWEAESEWETEQSNNLSSGSCILIPIPISTKQGIILRSLGYAEAVKAISNYEFLSDGTFSLTTTYEHSIAEEKIWFVSENVRCRFSVIKTSTGEGVIQTSFASEVRQLNILE